VTPEQPCRSPGADSDTQDQRSKHGGTTDTETHEGTSAGRQPLSCSGVVHTVWWKFTGPSCCSSFGRSHRPTGSGQDFWPIA
jgi:hypothetical protein